MEPSKSHRFGIKWFGFNYFCIICLRISLGTYTNGMTRTLERRFELRSRTLGIINSLNDLVLICVVLFVGYFGKRLHIPRVLSVCAVFLAISSVCMTMPFFIHGPLEIDNSAISVARYFNNTEEGDFGFAGSNSSGTQLCYPDANEAAAKQACSAKIGKDDETWRILVWFALAQVFSGLAASGIFTLGIAYLDANAPKDKLPVYLGFMNSAFSLAPLFGFGLAAAAAAQPEALFRQLIPRSDPRYIGCWWLGYLVVAILQLISAIPMMFFPRSMPKTKETQDTLHEKDVGNGSNASLGSVKHSSKKTKKNTHSAKQLLTSPTFILMIIVNVCAVYLIMTLFVNMPRYFEIHFRQPAAIANVTVGLLYVFASSIGSILGGFITKRRQMAPSSIAFFACILLAVMLICTAIVMFISCPSITMAGLTEQNMYEPVLECSTNCSCSTDRRTYQPVCGSDGLNYFSPCHAGCSSKISNTTFTDCQCLPPGGEAIRGFCDESCFQQVVIYTAVLFVGIFMVSLSRVPRTIVFLRLVPEEQKTLGLGISSFCTNLFGFVPAPILMGHLIDTTCVLWQMACGSSGACLLYDTSAFRYLIHGVAIVFMSIDLGLFSAVTCLLKKQEKNKKPELINNVSVTLSPHDEQGKNQKGLFLESEELTLMTPKNEVIQTHSDESEADNDSPESQPLKPESHSLTVA